MPPYELVSDVQESVLKREVIPQHSIQWDDLWQEVMPRREVCTSQATHK